MGNRKPKWTAAQKRMASVIRKREESAQVERVKLARVGILPAHLAELANNPPKQLIKGANAPRPRKNMTDKERRLNTTARRKRRPSNIPFNPAYFPDRDVTHEVPTVLAGTLRKVV